MLSLTCASTHVAAGSSNRATTRSRNCLYSSSGIASTSRTTQTVRAKLPRFGEGAASAEVSDARSRTRVGLYLNPPENAIVLCMDEETQTQ